MGLWSFWYSIRVEWGGLGLCARLRALTDLTAFDVGLDGLLHLWPPVLSEDQLLRFFDARMSGRDVIMELGDDFASERVMTRDIDASVVLQKSSFPRDSLFVRKRGFDPLIPQLFLSSGFLDLRMYFVGHGHDERPEMCDLEDNDVSVVVLALVVVVAAGQ